MGTASMATVDLWIGLIHSQDSALARDILAEDVCVLAYQEGKGGPLTTFKGRREFLKWIQHPPKGRFAFEILSAGPSEPSERLPSSEHTVSARYRVRHVEGDFSNEGDWTIAIRDEHVVGVLHTPEAIDEAE